MKKIHILENALRYLLDEGRNAEKAKQRTIAVIKSYLSQNGIQGEQLEAMAMEYEHSFKEWLFHANMPDSIIRLEPIMANVAMQLGFTPKDRDTKELYRLKKIMSYIIAHYNDADFPIALNKLTLDNTSFDSLNKLFGNAIDSNNSKGFFTNGRPKYHYTVKRLDTFEEAHKYYPYTQDICYLREDDIWKSYTNYGLNTVYVLLKDGWEDIPAEHGTDTPYDDYGESMVFIIINIYGDIEYSNTRWNHNTEGNGPRDVDQSFTEKIDVLNWMLQADYKDVLKPVYGQFELSLLKMLQEKGINLDGISPLTDNLYLANRGNKLTILNKNGDLFDNGKTWLIDVTMFENGLSRIERDDSKWSVINTKGIQICEWYSYITFFEKGIAHVQREDNKWSFINTEGKRIGDWYRRLKSFHNGLAAIQRDDGKWSFVSNSGQLIGGWYKRVGKFSHGLADVQREDGKISLINTEGQEICGWYKDINLFCNPYIAVQREDDKWAYMNTQGQIISDWYKNISLFEDNIAPIERDDGKMSAININGKQICGWYKRLYHTEESVINIQRDDDKWSLIDVNGKHICGWFDYISFFEYDDRFKEYVAIVHFNHQKYYIDTKGNFYDYKTIKPIMLKNESYLRLNNLIAETLQKSIRNYLLYN